LVMQEFLGHCLQIMTNTAKYLAKAYNVSPTELHNAFPGCKQHLAVGGLDEMDEIERMLEQIEKFDHPSLIPDHLVTPSRFANTVRQELRYLPFVMQHFADATKIRGIDEGYFKYLRNRNENELVQDETLLVSKIKVARDLIKSAQNQDEDKYNQLFTDIKKHFMLKWFRAKLEQQPAATESILQITGTPRLPDTEILSQPDAALDGFSAELSERMHELQRTPLLYKAWLAATRLDTACTGTRNR
jgi:hypothetical protein